MGGEEFRKEMLERIAGRLGEHHAGELRIEAAEAKAERIIGEELQRLGWSQADLSWRQKNDPGKLATAARLRRETILPLKWIANRLQLGTWKSANARLRELKMSNERGTSRIPKL